MSLTSRAKANDVSTGMLRVVSIRVQLVEEQGAAFLLV